MKNPSNHREYCIGYIELLKQKLIECKTISPDQINFTHNDKVYIEYMLKDVMRESVSAHLSTEECTAIFVARLHRLTCAKHEQCRNEWMMVRELIKQHCRQLTPEDIIIFDELARFFQNRKPKYI